MLSILSTVAAGVFAAIGAATETKRDGKLTGWGWLSVGGVIVSTVLVLAISLIDASSAAKAAAKSREEYEQSLRATRQISQKVNRTLNATDETLKGLTANLERSDAIQKSVRTALKKQDELSMQSRRIGIGIERAVSDQEVLLHEQKQVTRDTRRLLQPFDLTEVSFSIRYDASHPELQPYLQKLRDYAASHVDELFGDYSYYDAELGVSVYWVRDTTPLTLSMIRLERDSKLLPAGRDEIAATFLLNDIALSLDFVIAAHLDPMRPAGTCGAPDRAYEAAMWTEQAGDPRSPQHARYPVSPQSGMFFKVHFGDGASIEQWATRTPVLPTIESGAMPSLEDLAGATLCADILHKSLRSDMKPPRLEFLELGFGPTGARKERIVDEQWTRPPDARWHFEHTFSHQH